MYNHGDELSDRKKLILKAIIDSHINNGEPVGSKYLTQNKQITLSSATIRNEMAELEELGYLEQPHTSAGRVPSERGYRFYVNSLMESYRLTSGELKALGGLAAVKAYEIDKLLEGAAKVMSRFTRYTSLAVKPKPGGVSVSHFKAIPLGENDFLLVMMITADIIKTRHVTVGSGIRLSDRMLAEFEQVLNIYLAGVTVEQINLPMMMEMESKLGEGGAALVSPVIKCVYEVINELDSGELMLEGMNRLLEYPEYADIERLKSLLSLVEKKDDILSMVSNSERDVTNVYIGSENSVDIMQKSTLIFKTITRGGRVVGAIGVIGPCRMDYPRVITAVEHMAGSIGSMMKEREALSSASEGKTKDEKEEE